MIIRLKLALCGIFLSALSLAQAAVPPAGHVFVVVEENHSYSSVVGSAAMPYLNSLAAKYALATNYYANTHPSIGNYLMMTTGQIITNSDGYSGTISQDNLVRQLLTGGKTWKSYAESLPSVGYTGGDLYPYSKHHNPFSYFTDVVNSSTEKLNLVPFSQFAGDLANNRLPEFSFIVPNMLDNAHDGTLQQADNWLKANIAPLIASPTFQADGVLVILFDEAYSSDTTHGGGHVAAVVLGPKVTGGYKSTVLFQHQSLLRMIMEALGLSAFPGAASSAADMGDFFGGTVSPPPPPPPPPPTSTCTLSSVSPSVTICAPHAGTSLTSPVKVVAGTTSSTTVKLMQIYLDGVKVYQVGASTMNTTLTVPRGTHRLTVQAYNTAGAIFKTTEYVTVN